MSYRRVKISPNRTLGFLGREWPPESTGETLAPSCLRKFDWNWSRTTWTSNRIGRLYRKWHTEPNYWWFDCCVPHNLAQIEDSTAEALIASCRAQISCWSSYQSRNYRSTSMPHARSTLSTSYKTCITLILPKNKSKQLSMLNCEIVYNTDNKSFLYFKLL